MERRGDKMSITQFTMEEVGDHLSIVFLLMLMGVRVIG